MRPKLDLNLRNKYDRLFLVIFAVDVILRSVWLDKPSSFIIGDEIFYVGAAQVMLGRFAMYYPNAIMGLDPESTHPPLAKQLIALSIHLFGDNPYGWRIPSVIFGSLSVLVFYLLMKRTANRSMVPLVATFLFSFDNLIFVQSRIAMLDIFTLAFMLLGFYLYFSGHPHLSALGMALSSLTKITGAAGLVAIMLVEALRFARNRTGRNWTDLTRWVGRYLVVFAFSFFIILAVLDHFGGQWSPFVNIGHSIYESGGPLVNIGHSIYEGGGLVCSRGAGTCPWQWLINDKALAYYPGRPTIFDSPIAFWGAVNPAISLLAIPATIYSCYGYLKKKEDFTLFTVAWFATTYLPYYVLMFWHRLYIWYFLLTLPAVCAAIAYVITERRIPRTLAALYLAIVLLFFISMFPFKTMPT